MNFIISTLLLLLLLLVIIIIQILNSYLHKE